MSIPGLFSELTAKQADAHISPLDGGYYAVPRETTVGKIARARNAPGTKVVS